MPENRRQRWYANVHTQLSTYLYQFQLKITGKHLANQLRAFCRERQADDVASVSAGEQDAVRLLPQSGDQVQPEAHRFLWRVQQGRLQCGAIADGHIERRRSRRRHAAIWICRRRWTFSIDIAIHQSVVRTVNSTIRAHRFSCGYI